MDITLKITRLEQTPCAGKGVLSRYNIFFEGATSDGKEPAMKGVRLFESDREENRKYIRLPQQVLKNGRSMNLISLPEPVFKELSDFIIGDYEKRYKPQSISPDREINIDDIPF